MFIQVIQGKVADQAKLDECMQRWQTDLMPGAIGYLGSTSGTTDDGTFFAMVRFESKEAAMANSNRPEQSAWWAECATCFDGEPMFMDCDNPYQWMAGGSDDAGFVQVMEGRTANSSKLKELWDRSGDRIRDMRPEIIGGFHMEYGTSGDYVEAIYFTSEEEARKNESMEIPDDLRDLMEENMRLQGEVTYLDLHHPMLVSARR